MIDLGRRPVELDDQQRFDVERIAGMDELLGGVDRRPVHHLHAAGDDAGCDDARDAFAGVLGARKADQHGARRLRLLQDAHRHLGDDAEEPFRPGDDADEIVAAGIEVLAAKPQHLAGHQHHFQAEDVVGGHAVLQAVHAAGILRHVAADGAGDLRRRIGRVIEALAFYRRADGKIGDARLGHHHAVVEVDLADAVELAHAEQHAVGKRQRPARQRGARPARHHLDAVVVAVAQHFRHLFRGLGQHDHHRQLPVGGQPVGFVGPHRPLGRDHALARHDGRKRRHNLAGGGRARPGRRRA